MKKDDNDFIFGVFTLGMAVGGWLAILIAKLMLT
jgi:hypothetical protein